MILFPIKARVYPHTERGKERQREHEIIEKNVGYAYLIIGIEFSIYFQTSLLMKIKQYESHVYVRPCVCECMSSNGVLSSSIQILFIINTEQQHGSNENLSMCCFYCCCCCCWWNVLTGFPFHSIKKAKRRTWLVNYMAKCMYLSRPNEFNWKWQFECSKLIFYKQKHTQKWKHLNILSRNGSDHSEWAHCYYCCYCIHVWAVCVCDLPKHRSASLNILL